MDPFIPFKDVTNELPSSSATAMSDDDFLAKFPSVQIAGTTKARGKSQKNVRPRSIAEYAIEDSLLPCLSRGKSHTCYMKFWCDFNIINCIVDC